MRHIVRTLLLGGILFATLALAACAHSPRSFTLKKLDNQFLATAFYLRGPNGWDDDPPFSVRAWTKDPYGGCTTTDPNCSMAQLYLTVDQAASNSTAPVILFASTFANFWNTNKWKGTVTKDGETYKEIFLSRMTVVEGNGTKEETWTRYDVLVNPRRVIVTPLDESLLLEDAPPPEDDPLLED